MGRPPPGIDPAGFRASLAGDRPPADLSPELQVLWHDRRGDWDAAHDIAQDLPTAAGSWLHAYLHRREGDLSNAGYWYRRAGRSMPGVGLDQEWEALVEHFCAGQQ